jgi:phospholipid/cholesterol/gamma-HCH transport system substrate-binding protein
LRIKAETSVGLFILVGTIIFLYMTFQIGVLRFDRSRYDDYSLYFRDVAGLNKKSDVEIAGVKVGWVENMELTPDGQKVRVDVKILKEYKLYTDAYGLIRQDGLLGTKYLEIAPGNPLSTALNPGCTLIQPSKEQVPLDNLISEFQGIARNLHDITNALKKVMGDDHGAQRLERAIDSFHNATENFSQASRSVDDLLMRNKENFDAILENAKILTQNLKEDIPQLSYDIRTAIDRFVAQFEKTSEPIYQVAERANQGQGIAGWIFGRPKKERKIKKMQNKNMNDQDQLP